MERALVEPAGWGFRSPVCCLQSAAPQLGNLASQPRSLTRFAEILAGCSEWGSVLGEGIEMRGMGFSEVGLGSAVVGGVLVGC